ncbi:unnamed protein product [Lasius platythorax]|uniref:HAUS augmin-like complex subunit 6 N-terminal domain-containing protein n=1 Tax=Lasius platythorax TaxID=488582 RepID=A0AAV2N4X3_9HYME
MAVSTSFHRNVFLLNQLVPPSDDFKKVFREGMFDKPNIAGFIQVSYYLLMIYDAERFRKLVEWPVLCKKTEAKYRNDVKDYLNVIAVENLDIGFPNIVATYLHHASGTKFMLIMWKLSQLAVKKYLMRNGEHGVLSGPKPSLATDLTRTYLQQSKASLTSNTLSRHRSCIQMEKAVNSTLAEEKEQLASIKTELFNKKQSVTKCITTAPVAASIKQRLKNVEDSEIIQMWKSSLDENICYIQKQNGILKNLERICENISGIITNLSSDAKVLDGKQLEKINYSVISELPFPPDVQHCLYHLYNDNQLVYHNFIHLHTLILHQVYQCLRKDELVDLTQCQLQVEASVEDTKSMYNIFETILTNMKCSIEETQSVLCKKNMEYTSGQNVLPFINNVLLMPSPLIKINTNWTDEMNNLQRLLQLTPGEIAHKSLFSRYMRHKRIHTPDLRTNLFVSRIDIDSAISLDNNDKQSLNLRFMTPKVNKLSKKATGKYFRLFSTHTDKNIKANSSMMSLPPTAQANSSIIESTVGEMPNISNLNLDIIAKGYLNLSEETTIPCISASAQFTPVKRNISRNMSQEQARDKLDQEYKVNKPKLDDITEVQFVNDEDKGTVVKHEKSSRRSIGDLVERYKKLLEVNNSTMIKFQNECKEVE